MEALIQSQVDTHIYRELASMYEISMVVPDTKVDISDQKETIGLCLPRQPYHFGYLSSYLDYWNMWLERHRGYLIINEHGHFNHKNIKWLDCPRYKSWRPKINIMGPSFTQNVHNSFKALELFYGNILLNAMQES